MAIEIYADGAGLHTMAELAGNTLIKGFTTNPSLMRKAGISDYKTFAKEVLSIINGKPVSFEVVADEWSEMERQANELQSWGSNVWVKIPVTNTKGEWCLDSIQRLKDINLNVTAVMTDDQIEKVLPLLKETDILSIFCGRINDTGRAAPIFSVNYGKRPKILWASARHLFSLLEAQHMNYDIITLTPDLIAKLPLLGKDLTEYSLETVKMFHNDGKGLVI